MPRSSSSARSASGEARVPASTGCSEAPASRYGQVSHTAASKLNEASCVARSAAVTPKARACQAHRLSSAACGTITPLGRPVEPEV